MPGDSGVWQVLEVAIRDPLLSRAAVGQATQAGPKDDRSLGAPIAKALKRSFAHVQAAETGGADSGFFEPAMMSGRKRSSRTCVVFVSCFG